MTKERLMQLAKYGTFINSFDKDFKPQANNNGKFARQYLEGLGFKVIENRNRSDRGGYARTDNCIYLSTNGYCWYDESLLMKKEINTIEDVIETLEIMQQFGNKIISTKCKEMIEVLKCE